MTNVVGLKEITQALRRFPKKAAEASAQGQLQAYIDVMRLAKSRAPVDKDWVRTSGYVEDPEFKAGTVVVGAGFGGKSEDYVVRQHEDLSLNHPNGGQARFFASAIEDRVGQTKATIARFIKQFIDSGVVPQAERGEIPKTPQG